MNRSIEDISEYLVCHDLFGTALVSDNAVFERNDARGIAGSTVPYEEFIDQVADIAAENVTPEDGDPTQAA